MCTLCGFKIAFPTLNELKKHHNYCKQNPNRSTENQIDLQQFEAENNSNEIQYIHESSVSRQEIEAYTKAHAGRNVVDPGPGYKMRYLFNGTTVDRFGECQMCQRRFKKPSSYKLIMHR